MIDKIILVCCALFLPLGLLIANKLIDKAQIKQKDREINALKQDVKNLTAQKENAQRAQSAQQRISQSIGQFVSKTLGNSNTISGLEEQAKHVETEQEAIELARRQVEANR